MEQGNFHTPIKSASTIAKMYQSQSEHYSNQHEGKGFDGTDFLNSN